MNITIMCQSWSVRLTIIITAEDSLWACSSLDITELHFKVNKIMIKAFIFTVLKLKLSTSIYQIRLIDAKLTRCSRYFLENLNNNFNERHLPSNFLTDPIYFSLFLSTNDNWMKIVSLKKLLHLLGLKK